MTAKRPAIVTVVGSFGILGIVLGLYGVVAPCEELGCIVKFLAGVLAVWGAVATASFVRHPAGLAALIVASITAGAAGVGLAINGVELGLLIPLGLAALGVKERQRAIGYYLRREARVG